MNKRRRILIHHKKHQNQKKEKPLGVTQFFSWFIFVFVLSLILISFNYLPTLWPHGLSSVLFCALFSPLCYLIFSTQFCTWKFCMWWNCDTVPESESPQIKCTGQKKLALYGPITNPWDRESFSWPGRQGLFLYMGLPRTWP